MTLCREVMQEEPGAVRLKLAKKVKRLVAMEDASTRREHAESLPAQGQLMRDNTYASDIWASALEGLDSETLKFAINAATDTLPNNSNLAKWRKGSVREQCKLCGKKQTLLHVLNHCEKALNLRRYNTRHDKILGVIAETSQTYLPEDHHLTVDLGEAYHFPNHIVSTNLRPDMVVWSDVHRALYLIELTVCFETGFVEAAQRKRERYSDLVIEARETGYDTSVLPIQIGSRGALEETGLEALRKLLSPVPKRAWRSFLTVLATTAIEESFKIWCVRNNTI